MIKFAGTLLYTWVEKGTVRVKCLAQEHHTVSPTRAWTQTSSGVERTTRVLLQSMEEYKRYVIECNLTQRHSAWLPGGLGTSPCAPWLWNENKRSYLFFLQPQCFFVCFPKTQGLAVASWLVRSTPEQAAFVRAPAGYIALCYSVPLSTQKYNEWVPANCWGT